MEGFPWNDLCKILPECRQVTNVLNGTETLRKISIGWVGCTNVTDRRQTDARRHIANMNMSSRSLKNWLVYIVVLKLGFCISLPDFRLRTRPHWGELTALPQIPHWIWGAASRRGMGREGEERGREGKVQKGKGGGRGERRKGTGRERRGRKVREEERGWQGGEGPETTYSR